MDDAGDDIRWLTYAELGQIRKISTASATRLAFRRGWRRQDGNGKTVRVAVPIDEAKPTRDDRGDVRGDVAGVLEAALSALREQLHQAEARADRAEQAREAERTRTDALRNQVDGLQTQLVEVRAGAATTERTVREALARAEAEAAAERAARMQAEAEAAQIRQADQERRRLGRVARLLSAWRGA